MQNLELISVIVPVYNVEKYIRECLDSIVNQTYKNLQIILVDDGSTDNSGKIVMNLQRKTVVLQWFIKRIRVQVPLKTQVLN